MNIQLEERIDEQKNFIILLNSTKWETIEVNTNQNNGKKSKNQTSTKKPVTSDGRNLQRKYVKDNDTEALSNPNDTHHKAEIESRNLLTPSEEKQTNKGTYKTRKMDVIRGTGTEICSLKSVDRKAWLY